MPPTPDPISTPGPNKEQTMYTVQSVLSAIASSPNVDPAFARAISQGVPPSQWRPVEGEYGEWRCMTGDSQFCHHFGSSSAAQAVCDALNKRDAAEKFAEAFNQYRLGNARMHDVDAAYDQYAEALQ